MGSSQTKFLLYPRFSSLDVPLWCLLLDSQGMALGSKHSAIMFNVMLPRIWIKEHNISMNSPLYVDILGISLINLLFEFLFLFRFNILFLIDESALLRRIINSKYSTSHSSLMVFIFSFCKEKLLLPLFELEFIFLHFIELFQSFIWSLPNYRLLSYFQFVLTEVFLSHSQAFVKVIPLSVIWNALIGNHMIEQRHFIWIAW